MSNLTPQCSVILPTRNRARLLWRAAASVLAQTHADLELIVVDDASTDDTAAVLATIDDPRVRVIRLAEPGGAAAARNRGLAEARGPLIAFQDSDDEWQPQKLERQVTVLTAATERAGLCVCSMEVRRGDTRHQVRYRDQELDQVKALALLVSGTGMGTPCWLVRRDTILAAGGFNEALPRMQDYECALRIARQSRVILMSDLLVTAHIGSDSLSASADGYARAIEIIVHEHQDLFDRDPAGHSHMTFRAGKYFALEGRRREALRWFLRALRIQPSNGRALAGLILCATGLFPFFKGIKYSK